MKKTILFAVSMSAVLLSGCLPQQKLTGKIIDQNGPVPGAAVLAMVWVEDSGKALSAPDIKNLEQKELDAVLEKDMADRGLPIAYARAFTDDSGEFTLDKLHFSADTKKAVKAMTQPKITRVTINAFQRGYLKHAATVFPRGISEELAPATIKLPKPESWKQLALDNYFRLLRRDEFDQAYSKHFGATKEEKKWFLDYVSGNLNDAYQASNIKDDKQWVEDCGHNPSDILISSAGIQYNPAREKCNLLLRQAGVLRDWEELWLTHAYAPTAGQSPAVSAIKEAIDGLGPEYAEVKQYEGEIIEGASEAENAYRRNSVAGDLRNGLKEAMPVPGEMAGLYNGGDKAGAYKALGYSLFHLLSGDLKQGTVTAMLPVTVIPKIRETASGFYLVMNRPLTAQLPGGDDGNHKDKPGKKVEESTETIKDNDGRIKYEEEELVFKNHKGALVSEFIANNEEEKAEIVRKYVTGKFNLVETKTFKNPRLRFYGESGAILKEIPINKWERKILEKAGKDIATGEAVDTFWQIEELVEISPFGKHVFLQSKTREGIFKYMEGSRSKADWKIFDYSGKQLWERKGEDIAMRAAMSDAGSLIVILGGGREGGGDEKLKVYDKAGTIIFSYPDAGDTVAQIHTDMLKISPNGRYLAVRVSFDDFSVRTVFFDLKTKKVWKVGYSYVIYTLTDSGLVECDFYDEDKQQRSITKFIDIKPYFKN